MTGPIVAIEIHVPTVIAQQLTAANQPVPAPASGLALVDTGATLTSVHEPILQALGLHPVGPITSGTAAGLVVQNAYAAQIRIPSTGTVLELAPVGAVDLKGQIVQVPGNPPLIALLGRNLLMHGVLVYNGSAGMWSFSI